MGAGRFNGWENPEKNTPPPRGGGGGVEIPLVEHGVLTFAVFSAFVSIAYKSVDNSFVSFHVTYDIKDEQEQHSGYDQDCDGYDQHV